MTVSSRHQQARPERGTAIGVTDFWSMNVGLVYRNGRPYLYESERVNGRVVTRYGGSGQMAVLGAQLNECRRDMRRANVFDRRLNADIRAAKLAGYRAMFARAESLTAHILTAAGWHRHHRGEWRRTRGLPMKPVPINTVLDTWVPSEVATVAGSMSKDVEDKAATGDRSAVPAIDEYLANPAAVALWGDTGRLVLMKWVRLYAGKNLTYQRAVVRFASELRSRLAGDDPDALAVLSAERVVLAWVAAAVFDSWFANALDKNLSVKLVEHYQKQADLGQRQLLSAVRTLAKVRRTKLADVMAVVSVDAPVSMREAT